MYYSLTVLFIIYYLLFIVLNINRLNIKFVIFLIRKQIIAMRTYFSILSYDENWLTYVCWGNNHRLVDHITGEQSITIARHWWTMASIMSGRSLL